MIGLYLSLVGCAVACILNSLNLRWHHQRISRLEAKPVERPIGDAFYLEYIERENSRLRSELALLRKARR